MALRSYVDFDRGFAMRTADDFTSLGTRFPRGWLGRITPSRLLSEGFKKIDRENYEKTFSDVLTLRIEISRLFGTYYYWTINEKTIKKMIEDLRALRAYIDIEVRELRRGPITSKGSFVAAAKGVHAKQREFFKKYKDFLSLCHDIEITAPYPRFKYFFFDACRTRTQLRLYFEFIELYLELFGVFRTSRRVTRRITPGKLKQAILGYYVLLYTIRRIRKMYQKSIPFEELKAKFSSLPEEAFEDITLDAREKKGWAHKASGLALGFASFLCQTTPTNFKQMLKKERPFANEIKKKVSRTPDLDRILAGEGSIEEPFFSGLRGERSQQANLETFRVALLHYFDPPEIRISLKKG